MRWLLASLIRTALGLAAGTDEDAQHVGRVALLLSSPMAWLSWRDYLGLSAHEAAETAGWAICRLAGGSSSEAPPESESLPRRG